MTAERALLAAIIRDDNVLYQQQPREWWFTDQNCRALFRQIQSMAESGEKIDEYTVPLKGHTSFTSEILDEMPTAANASYYAKICKEQGARAELAKLPAIISDGVKQRSAQEIIDEIHETVERVVTGSNEYQIKSVNDLLLPLVNEIEDNYHRGGEMPGIPTGYPMIDDMLDGLQEERLYVIGARPSQGKSALALNMASYISTSHRVGFISLESGWREMLYRELSSVGRLNSQLLMRGSLGKKDFDRLTEAAETVNSKMLYIYDKPNLELSELVAQARRMRQRYEIDVLFVDYLQLVQSHTAETDRERVVYASNRLKDLSRELHIPVVALAQLRRDADGRRPTLGDFQHSSQIEQDADTGMLLYHRFPDGDKEQDPDIFLLVDKNRDGRKGAVPLYFHPEYVTFYERTLDNA